jgi:hypothetical protein
MAGGDGPAALQPGGAESPLVHAKFFTPDAQWTWFVLEYDPAERLCFGLVCGQVEELGYFSLDELRAVRGPLGLRIERDLWWRPEPLSQVRGGKAR